MAEVDREAEAMAEVDREAEAMAEADRGAGATVGAAAAHSADLSRGPRSENPGQLMARGLCSGLDTQLYPTQVQLTAAHCIKAGQPPIANPGMTV